MSSALHLIWSTFAWKFGGVYSCLLNRQAVCGLRWALPVRIKTRGFRLEPPKMDLSHLDRT